MIYKDCFSFEIKPDRQAYIFCFYHAGGNANMLRSWMMQGNDVQIVLVEYPGHGTRYSESCCEDIVVLAKDMAQKIAGLKINRPVYFYGHSVGALLAFETAYLIEKNYPEIDLRKLIVSGRHAPHKEDPSEYRTSMGREKLIEDLRRMKETEEELLNSRAFLDFYIPIITSDYKMNENYVYDNEVLNIPIVAHCGSNDRDARMFFMKEWSYVTNNQFSISEFNGEHFFVLDEKKHYADVLIDIVKQDMLIEA